MCDFIKSYFINQELDFSSVTPDQKVQLDSLADLAKSIDFDGKSPDYMSKVNKVSQLLNLYMHILNTGKQIAPKKTDSIIYNLDAPREEPSDDVPE